LLTSNTQENKPEEPVQYLFTGIILVKIPFSCVKNPCKAKAFLRIFALQIKTYTAKAYLQKDTEQALRKGDKPYYARA